MEPRTPIDRKKSICSRFCLMKSFASAFSVLSCIMLLPSSRGDPCTRCRRSKTGNQNHSSRRRLPQAQALGEAESRQEEDAAVRQGRDPAGGVHRGAEDGWVRAPRGIVVRGSRRACGAPHHEEVVHRSRSRDLLYNAPHGEEPRKRRLEPRTTHDLAAGAQQRKLTTVATGAAPPRTAPPSARDTQRHRTRCAQGRHRHGLRRRRLPRAQAAIEAEGRQEKEGWIERASSRR